MKTITLLNNADIAVKNILLLPNYVLDHIYIGAEYDLLIESKDLYSTILLLTEKLSIGGSISIEVLDMRLVCEHYLASIIQEQDFTKLICQNINKKIDIPYLRLLIKDKNDIHIKNISSDKFLNTVTIERQAIP